MSTSDENPNDVIVTAINKWHQARNELEKVINKPCDTPFWESNVIDASRKEVEAYNNYVEACKENNYKEGDLLFDFPEKIIR